MSRILPQIFPHMLAIAVFLVLSALYFRPQLSGKVMQQGDIQQYQGMAKELIDYKKSTGETTLWTNSMFGGMPTYQISSVSAGNTLKPMNKVARLSVNGPIGRFLALMVGFYILLVVLGVNPWLGIIGALAFGLSTNNFILLEAGHNSKLDTIACLPYIAAGMLLAFRKSYLTGAILFGVGLGMALYANHPQMTYYFAITLLIFGVARLIYDIREKQMVHFAKASGALVIAGLLAVGSAASNLLITYEYSHSTMRGKPVLAAGSSAGNAATSNKADGLDWDYAMGWSNGLIDLFVSYIPGAAGGSSAERIGKGSIIYQDLLKMGAQLPETIQLPLYWGALGSTSGPIYFGAAVFFFFLLGLMLVKGPVKWWLGLGVLLTLLISLGKNLEWFNRIFFDYFPMYNKFRTPNSVLSITPVLMALLGFLALDGVFKGSYTGKEIKRALLISGGVCAALSLFFVLLGPSFFEFSHPRDAQLVEQGLKTELLVAERRSLMRSDAFRSLVLAGLSFAAIWFYNLHKVKKGIAMAILAALVLFDAWTLGRRYVDEGNFLNKNSYQSLFQARPVDELIRKDVDPYYRVHDVTADPFNSASASYFHKTIGGYSAVKLQRYQDMIERYIGRNHMGTLNMLNTKYFIVPDENNQPRQQINFQAYGNAWFVDSLVIVNTPNEEIAAIDSLDLSRAAVVLDKEFNGYVSGFDPQKNGDIKLTSYKPNKLAYESNTSSEQLAVFSEVWYGPNLGWQAYMDGKPADHIRVNYLLRAMRIPAGQHKIEFVFDPKTYHVGRSISMATSLILLLGLCGVIGLGLVQWWNKAPEPAPVKPPLKEQVVKEKLKPAVAKKKKR